jgi:hypothetical protein
MKGIILILLIDLSSNIFAQEDGNLFSDPHFSIHGGLSFSSIKNGWGAYLVEGKSNVSENLLLKLSFGYTNLINTQPYKVKSYSERDINNNLAYETVTYEVSKIEYQIIPISIGLQYNVNKSLFNPYTFLEIGYNLIDPKSYRNNYEYGAEYQSYGELPLEHRYIDAIPKGSYKIAIGVGFNYPLSAVFGLDMRFLTQIDSEIMESQQLLVGISF